jgi:hypothetical protein
VQLIGTEKSYMKEALQRAPDVLLSGPFKKVSHTVFWDGFTQAPRSDLQGQTSGTQVLGDRQSDGRLHAFRPKKAFCHKGPQNSLTLTMGGTGKDS